MALGFFGLRAGQIDGIVSPVITARFAFGILRDYETLSASLLAYSVSTLVCFFMSVRSKQNFDIDVIQYHTGDFDPTEEHELALQAVKRGKKHGSTDEQPDD
ncbi:MAG: hypothetical protein ACTH05_09775 [Yaniella sp.]